MAHSTDLYSILKTFVHKIHSPYIEIAVFLDFLAKLAVHRMQEDPEWVKWTSETEVKFWNELNGLTESGKCILQPDSAGGGIYMPFYYADKLRTLYFTMEKMADLPFPDEDYLKMRFPEGQLRIINLETDMGMFFKPRPFNPDDESKPETAEQPGTPPNSQNEKADEPKPAEAPDAALPEIDDQIFKIVFPSGFGSTLVPAYCIPRRLIEISFHKMRGYLYNHGNKEFILHKLSPYLPGREKYLRETIELLLARPTECFGSLETSGDFASLFWSCFCSLVKNDILKKNDFLSEDTAAMQASAIIAACNMFYKQMADQRKDQEAALKSLDQHLDKAPFYFSLDDIIKFTNDKGVPLLQIYTNQALEAYIRRKTTSAASSKKNELPEWLILQGKNGERWYIKKTRYLPLCSKMLISVRPHIKSEITSRWVKLLRDFNTEPAMEKDGEFERLLLDYTENLNSPLVALLEDPKLLLVYSEMEHVQTNIPAASRIIKDGSLLPLNQLYAFQRKDLLFDAKMTLPFWYSIPVISSIIAFFVKSGNRKKRKKQHSRENTGNYRLPETSAIEARSIQNAARSLEDSLIPEGLSLEEHLSDLESRWSRVLDEDARQDLVSDVKAMLRDNLRYAVKIHKTKRLSTQSLGEIADFLIVRNPGLQRLGSRLTLHKYMQLYMLKLLINAKA